MSRNYKFHSSGAVKEQRQFGAWGKVDKFLDSDGNTTFTHASLLGRGYTGHEHFFDVNLIHMNGRMYDAQLGRFLSPDNYIQDPFNTQSYNRYGYVLNNPLKYIDPSGELWKVFIAIIIAIVIVAVLVVAPILVGQLVYATTFLLPAQISVALGIVAGGGTLYGGILLLPIINDLEDQANEYFYGEDNNIQNSDRNQEENNIETNIEAVNNFQNELSEFDMLYKGSYDEVFSLN